MQTKGGVGMNDGWTGAVGGSGRYGRVRSVIAPSRLRLLSMQSNRLIKGERRQQGENIIGKSVYGDLLFFCESMWKVSTVSDKIIA